MSKLSHFFQNSLYLGIMNVMSKASGLALNIFLVRILTPETFGLFALFQRLVEKVSSAIRVGGFEASTHVLTASNQTKNVEFNPFIISTPFFLRLGICIFAAGIFFTYPEFIATNILRQVSVTPYMAFLTIAACAAAMEVLSEGILKGLNQFKILSKVNIIFAFLLLIAIALASFFYDIAGSIISLSLCLITRSVIVCAIAMIHAKKAGFRLIPKDSIDVLSQHIKIGLPFYIPVLIAAPVGIYALSLLIDIAGIDDMAYYRVIITCAVFIHVIPQSILPVFITSTANEESPEENYAFIYSNLKFTILFSTIVSILLIGILPLFISIVFGSEYALAVKYFVIHAITIVLVVIYNIISSYFLAKKKVHFFLFSSIAHSIGFLFASIFLIPRYGLPGFLVAELIAYIICVLVAIITFGKKIELNNKIFIFVLRCLPFGILFILSMFGIDNIELVVLRLSSSLIIAIFLALFFWKTILSTDNKEVLKTALSQKLSFIRISK